MPKYYTFRLSKASMVMSDIPVSQDLLNKRLRSAFRNRGVPHRKVLRIHARPARKGEHVVTITSDGVESTNTADVGDFIVENQTTARERYVVTAAKFQNKYTHVGGLGHGWAVYEPNQESLILAIEVDETVLQQLGQDESFQIEAPWGSAQRVNRGDFLVAPTDLGEIYRIGAKEFGETYETLVEPG